MESLYDRISDGTISVDEITASMERSTSAGGKYFQSMEKQSKTLNGQVSTLKDNFGQFAGVLAEDTTNAISSEFLPAINDTISAMQEGFSKDGFEGLATAFSEGFTNILMMLVEKAPEIVDVAMTMIQSFINSIQENLPMIMNSAIQIITTLVQGILQMLPQIVQMGIQIIVQLIQVILQMLPQILQTGIQIIVQLIQGIAQQAPTLIPQIIDCIMLMVDTILDNIDLMIDAGIELIIALAMGLIDALPEIIDKIPIIIEKILTAIAENLPKLMEMGIKLIIQLALGLIKAIPQLVSKIPQIIGAIVKAFGTYISNMFDVGKNLIKGLWNGVQSKWNELKNKVADLAGSIVSKFKSVFGIKSPSRVFRDEIGKYLAEGMGVGFENELDNVYNSMQRAVDLETEKMSANVQTGKVFNTLNATTPIVVNLSADVEMDSQKVGRIITPTVSKTLKTGGAI